MTKHTNTRYNADFKKSIVNLYREGRSAQSLSDEFGPHVSSIHKWIELSKDLSDNGKTITVADYRAMKKEMTRLKEENKILKLAAVLLAKD